MSSMAIPVPARSIFAPPTSHSSDRLHRRHFIASSIHHRAFSFSVVINLANPTNFSTSSSSGIRSSQREDAESSKTENFSGAGEGEDKGAQKVFGDQENKTTGGGSTFLVKLAIALGIAATVTLVSISFKNLMHGPSPGAHYLADGSPSSTLVDPSTGFTFKAFGRAIVIPQYAPGKTVKEHEEHLRRTLQVMQDNTLLAKLSKCAFLQTSIEYLGHIISDAGVAADARKIAAMKVWHKPTNLKALRGFLGLTGYYRRFVKHYGIISKPLTQMLKK